MKKDINIKFTEQEFQAVTLNNSFATAFTKSIVETFSSNFYEIESDRIASSTNPTLEVLTIINDDILPVGYQRMRLLR